MDVELQRDIVGVILHSPMKKQSGIIKFFKEYLKN